MGNLWLKIKVWLKTSLATIVLVYVAVFVIKNTGQTVTIWYWYNTKYDGELLLLMMVTFLAGALTYFLVRATFRTLGQIRELRQRQQQTEAAEMVKKAAMLQHPKPPGTMDVPPPPSTSV